MSRKHDRQRRKKRRLRLEERRIRLEKEGHEGPPGRAILHLALTGFRVRGGWSARFDFQGPLETPPDGLPPRRTASGVTITDADGTSETLELGAGGCRNAWRGR